MYPEPRLLAAARGSWSPASSILVARIYKGAWGQRREDGRRADAIGRQRQRTSCWHSSSSPCRVFYYGRAHASVRWFCIFLLPLARDLLYLAFPHAPGREKGISRAQESIKINTFQSLRGFYMEKIQGDNLSRDDVVIAYSKRGKKT